MTPPSRVARMFWSRLASDRDETARQIAEIEAKMPEAENQVQRGLRCLALLDELECPAARATTSLRNDSSRPVGVETLPGLHQRG